MELWLKKSSCQRSHGVKYGYSFFPLQFEETLTGRRRYLPRDQRLNPIPARNSQTETLCRPDHSSRCHLYPSFMLRQLKTVLPSTP